MKIFKILAASAAVLLLLCGCAKSEDPCTILLSEEAILVNGNAISREAADAVFASNDIIYYEAGKDFTYGEGTEEDSHDATEAAAHTVINITEPGEYRLSGSLQKGQIAVNLGDDAKDDPEAVVTLYLEGVDISCSVAPAVIFYNVYECGDEDSPSSAVDTSAAGANIVLADGSKNTLNGSYVARIYKEITLSEDGTEVIDSKKLHKYDGALYSRMSMNISGTGALTVNAENEGVDSEMHLTINGGDITVNSGNDGINTNEDGVSVTTVNGGRLSIRVNGSTGEGDGIDSNGWLVINGGEVYAEACSTSMDSGIDSDMGIHINGGTVVATGTMLDTIAESGCNYAVFSFGERQAAGKYLLSAENSDFSLEFSIENQFTNLIVASEFMEEGEYRLRKDGSDVLVTAGASMGGFGGFAPGDFGGKGENSGMPPEGFEGGDMPEGFTPGDIPEGFGPESFGSMERPDGDFAPPEGFAGNPAGVPQWNLPDMPVSGEFSPVFTIVTGGNYFTA